MTTLFVSACQPAGPPPDLVKTQRQALDKAKGVELQLQQHAQDRMQSINDADK